MDEKAKPILTGSAETMLQSFYARAKYSKSKNHKFYDAKAIELTVIRAKNMLRFRRQVIISPVCLERSIFFNRQRFLLSVIYFYYLKSSILCFSEIDIFII